MPPSERRLPARADRGYVTAETAVVVPSLVLLVAMLLWGVTAGGVLIRCVDAARAGARAAARGETPATVAEVVRTVGPRAAEVEVVREGALVHVRVTARSAGPAELTLPLRAQAVAYAEESAEAAR
jgi:hypothetical protein